MATTCDLISILGKRELTTLQQAIGPAQIYIPTEARGDHSIADAVGVDSMAKICEQFGGTTIWIGNGYANLRRNEEILHLVLIGEHKENIARRFGISIRYVRFLTRNDVAPIYLRRARRQAREIASKRTKHAQLGQGREHGRE